MKNNNGASIRKLSNRSLKNNRMRNVFAVLAIALTGMLFTAAFSLVSGMTQVAQEQTMQEVGGRAHVGLKEATQEQYEKIIADPMVKKSDYNIYIAFADNILKRQAEIRYLPGADAEVLSDYFITLEEGRMPEAEDEIVVSSFTMDELGISHEVGQEVPLTFTFLGERIEKEFTVSGWYQGSNISHADELFVAESYWNELKGNRMDADFKAWGETYPNDSGVGLMAVNLYFDNASNLEEKVRTVIENAGYEPGTELKYGVNWAYMSSRMESVDPLTYLFLGAVVAVILLTGYLIIYNIFSISVIADIRFYGLLKMIGTTKKQLKWLVRRQAVILSAIGIPIGLLAGYGIGKAVLPFALSFMDFGDMKISMKSNPWIFVLGAGFSMLTVFLSCRKPGKIAGSVSPVEAVKYTEADVSKKKQKKSKKRGGGARIVSMAAANLGRNKKKTAVVVAAISLSMILLTVVVTAVWSFRLDSFLEQRIVGDFMLANVSITSLGMGGDYDIDEAYLELADAQEGITEKNELWVSFAQEIKVDEQAGQRYQALADEGKLREDPERLEQLINGERGMDGYFYGYSEELLDNLKILEGTFDKEKFASGNYILLGKLLGDGHLEAVDHVYHPGEKVTVESITEDSGAHEVKGKNGETMDVWYDNLEEKEYEVMAIVEFPYSMSTNRYAPNVCDAVLPLSELQNGEGNSQCFAVSYRVEEAYQGSFEAAIKDYADQVNTQMSYLSKDSLQNEFGGMVKVIATIGIALAAVISLIGILNFINAMVTGILARKRELAMLTSIGMTDIQLQKMLIFEGIGYVGIAAVVSFILGSLLSKLILGALNNVIMFFEYRFQMVSFAAMVPVLLIVAVCVPLFSYRRMKRKSIVERLREAE